MADASDLPQWLSAVAGGAGIIIATVIVRLGWNSKSPAERETQPERGRLLGAIVDSSSVREWTLAIQAHAEVVNATAEELTRAIRSQSDETRNLSDEVRRLANKIEK